MCAYIGFKKETFLFREKKNKKTTPSSTRTPPGDAGLSDDGSRHALDRDLAAFRTNATASEGPRGGGETSQIWDMEKVGEKGR